ncbi:MAG: beta-propeller domain-containing protein [Phycisphaerae bacterium]
MRRRSAALRISLLTIPVLFLLGGCPLLPPATPVPKGDPALKPFDSASEMIGYFRTQVQARNSVNFFGVARSTSGDLAVLESAPPPVAPGDATAGNDSAGGDGDGATFTSTNLQEAGVDESDVLKSDGRHLFVARNKSLFILDSKASNGTDNDLRQIARLDLGRPIDSIYLRGETILALAQDYGYGGGFGRPEILIYPPYYTSSSLTVFQIDVSDPANPEVLEESEFDGALVSSRLLNNRLILILNIVPDVPAATNPIALANLQLDAIMPKVRMAGSARNIAEWDEWLRPENPDGYNMTAVVTLDADDVQNIVRSVAVMANAGTIYSSADALYISDTDYDAQNSYKETTEIHKFAYGSDGAATYVASGAVRGRPLNQYSLGEFDGALRIATHIQDLQFFTDGNVTGIDVAAPAPADTPVGSSRAQNRDATTGPSNSVYVLRESAGKLTTVGAIEGIAPGERIYSARFMQDRGFLVTFEQVDPLFVLDLADDENPSVVGELKIPGFSDYLHLVGDDRLIGVGRATEVAPWGGIITAGMQISLFDVSDPENPTAIQQMAIGGSGSQSDVSYNPKAFTLFQRDGAMIMALPAVIWRNDSSAGDFAAADEFSGVLTFDVDLDEGFSERGRISAVADSVYHYVDWRRAAVISDQIFAISTAGVRAARLDDMTMEDVVVFPSIAEEFDSDVPSGTDGGGTNAGAAREG